MSIHESFENANFDELFHGMLESNRLADQGIMSFEKRMLDKQEELTKKIVGIKGSYSSVMEDAEEELNDEWRFHEATAKVSGRIYLADSSLVDLVPEKWGESETDENGDLFYYVEDVSLKSHGIEAIPEFDSYDEDEHERGISVVGVKIGYSFADEEDQFDRPIYTAYPGELIKHEYTMVTPEEAEVRLRQHWPKELGRCEALLKPDAKTPVTQRITALCRFLQDEIKHDEEFAKLFEVYVNSKLALDATLPYIMTAENALSSFDGDDLYDDDAYRQWVHLSITGQLTFLGYGPRIHISSHTDGSVRMHILVATYNSEDGDEPEYISVSTENITQFRSTRVSQSIAARAVMGLFDNVEGLPLQQASAAMADVEISDGPVEIEQVEPRQHKVGRKTEELEQLRSIRTELELIAKEVRKKRVVVYSTIEDATHASREIVTEIRSRLNGVGLTTAHELEVSGDQAYVPRFAKDAEIIEKYPSSIFVAIDPKDPLYSISNGDSINGTLDSFQPFVKERRNAENAIVGYIVNPSVFLEPSRGGFKQSVMRWQGASIVDATIETKAIVPLDGSVEVKLVALETLDGIHSSFATLKKEYGSDSEIVKKVRKFIRALASEEKSEYVTLANPEVIKSIGVEIGRMAESGISIAKAIEATTSLLINRNLQVSGEIYNVVDGKVTSRMKLAHNQVVVGNVVDIRDDIWPGRPTIVLHSPGDEVRYVPLDAVEIFRF